MDLKSDSSFTGHINRSRTARRPLMARDMSDQALYVTGLLFAPMTSTLCQNMYLTLAVQAVRYKVTHRSLF